MMKTQRKSVQRQRPVWTCDQQGRREPDRVQSHNFGANPFSKYLSLNNAAIKTHIYQ